MAEADFYKYFYQAYAVTKLPIRGPEQMQVFESMIKSYRNLEYLNLVVILSFAVLISLLDVRLMCGKHTIWKMSVLIYCGLIMGGLALCYFSIVEPL